MGKGKESDYSKSEYICDDTPIDYHDGIFNMPQEELDAEFERLFGKDEPEDEPGIKLYRYIGKSCVAFEHGSIYEAEKEIDEALGPMYAVNDESMEWYLYSVEFFEENFEQVD